MPAEKIALRSARARYSAATGGGGLLGCARHARIKEGHAE